MDSDVPTPELQGLQPIFQCDVLQDHIPPEHYFHEFQVNIGPDLEDLFDNIEGLPDLLDIEESDIKPDSDEEEDWEKEWYPDTEEGSFNAQDAQPETRNTSGAETSAASAHVEEERPGKEREAPLQPVAKQALEDLKQLLNPARKTGRSYLDPGLDSFVRTRMESMRTILHFYTQE